MPFSAAEELDIYRELVRSRDDILLIAAWESARFVYANQAALDALGYTLEELTQMSGGDLGELPREQHARLSQELIEQGRTHIDSVPIRCKDGTRLRMDLSAMRFSHQGADYNATLLRRSQAHRFELSKERLSESEAFYRSVVTCTEDSVIVFENESGMCVEANPAACRLFGYSTVEFKSVRRESLFGTAAVKLLAPIDDELRRTGRAATTETQLIRRDGSSFVSDTMQNAFEVQGRRMVVMVLRDVSDRQLRREQLERSQRLAAVGEVAAGIAHEINNPAAFVLMNADIIDEQLEMLERFHASVRRLCQQEMDPARKATLEQVLANAPSLASLREAASDNRNGIERIQAVSRDLRLFSRMEERVVVEGCLSAIASSAVRLVRNEIRHRAQLELELDPNLPKLALRRGKLDQVIINLLLNALQAIPEGNAKDHRIAVRTQREEDGLSLRVQDSGVGIDSETLLHVFEPFFTTKPTERGTGLGLALCASIVADHRGRIDVHSTPGEGSEFCVWLPFDTGLSVRKGRPAPTDRPAPRRRVLVIDDDPGMVRAYRRTLRDHDATVISQGAEALALLAKDCNFDLILCDLMMPEVDGEQVYRTLEKLAPDLVERIVFCTGGAFTTRARAFIESIRNEVLEKPVSKEDLQRVLRTCTSGPD